MFIVVDTMKNLDFTSSFSTLHADDRMQRRAVYSAVKGAVLGAFIIDKNHEKGLEIHVIFEGAIVEIYNLQSKRFITTLALRKPQVLRYLDDVKNDVITDEIKRLELIKASEKNQNSGLNNK
jgi:hypothetical protein